MNRREFIASCASALFIGRKAFGSPIKSCIGAKEILSEENGIAFENPYVTDGLCTQWDGIWNVGFGKHERSTGIWKDLIGSSDLTIPSGLYVGDDSLYTKERGNVAMRTPVISEIRDAINSGILTVEFIGLFFSADAQNDGIASIYQNVSIRPMSIYAVNAVTGTIRRYRGMLRGASSIAYGSTTKIADRNNPYRISVVGVFSNGYLTQYVNGVNVGIFELPESETANVVDGMVLNILNHPTSAATFDGEVCSIRIYSKPLSEEEVVYNYLIDKERFELP